MSVDDQSESNTPDDPISYFVRDMTLHGRSDRTNAAYERVLREFDAFLIDRGVELSEADQRTCMTWVHSLRGHHADSTVASYAAYVHRFYAYMTQIGTFDSNPMALVMEEMDESIDTDPTRREISMSEMRGFFSEVRHPLQRALIGTLLKTGMRVGECCNLDLRDVYLDDSDLERAYAIPPRGTLEGRPDSIYVSNAPKRGEEYNGEVRTASNKRKRDTIVPVDPELKRVLKAWLAVRPDTEAPGDPFFCSTSEWGRRATPSMVRTVVSSRASKRGWHRKGGGSEENVTPHYFRHFFTTHMRDRTGDRGIVKYLRGDVATDVIDTYTHNWGDRVRVVYEDSIYRLS